MRIPLRFKMIGGTVLLMMVIIAIFSALQVRLVAVELERHSERLRKLRTEHARTVGVRTVTSIAATSRAAIVDGRSDELTEQLEPVVSETRGSDLEILEVAITDRRGEVVTFVRRPGDKGRAPQRLEVVGVRGPEVEFIDADGQPSRVVVAAPIRDAQGAPVGYARFVYNLIGLRLGLRDIEREASRRSEEVLVQAALLGALSVLLGIVMAVLQALAITRPLGLLSTQVMRIAEGDIDARVPVTTKDEIGAMAQNVNQMAERIKALLVETATKTALERELEVARIIQETILPPRGEVRVGPVQLSGFLESASLCGGDFWNWTQLSEGRVLLVIGDVTGHGVPSAMITAAARSGLDTLCSVTRGRVTVAHVLDELNKTVHSAARRKFTMTMFAITIDPYNGRAEIANAGHNFPICVSPQGPKVTSRALVARGNRLGDSNDSTYSARQETLQNGDLLCLYTDGLTEARDPSGEEFGERRLRRLLHKHARRSPDEIIAELRKALVEFCKGHPIDDDVTLVIARFRGQA